MRRWVLLHYGPMKNSSAASFARVGAFIHYTQSLRTPQIGSSAIVSLLRPYLKEASRLMIKREQISTEQKVYKYTMVPSSADVGDPFNFNAL